MSKALIVEGKRSRTAGLTLEAVGYRLAIGSLCSVEAADSNRIKAEIVGFAGERLYHMPAGDIRGLE